MKWFHQYLLDPEVVDGCDSTESQSQLGQGKPCKYGLECTRPNCKFGHGGQPMKHSASFTGISSNHLVPSELRCKVQPEGGLVCMKPNENPDEFLSVSYQLWVVETWYPMFKHL